jgi:hypothetical protein
MSKLLIAVALLVTFTAPTVAAEYPSIPPGAFGSVN